MGCLIRCSLAGLAIAAVLCSDVGARRPPQPQPKEPQPRPPESVVPVYVEPAKVLIKAPLFEGGYMLPSISPDSKRLVGLSRIWRRVRVFDLASGEVVCRPQNGDREPVGVVFLTNDKVAVMWMRAARSPDKVLLDATVHDVKTGAVLHKMVLSAQPGNLQANVAASPDGSRLVTRGFATEIWNTETGERVCEIKDELGPPPPDANDAVDRTQVSDDGRRLMLSRGTGKWRTFLMSNGEPVTEVISNSSAGEVEFSADGNTVSVSGGQTLQLIDANSGKSILTEPAEKPPTDSARMFGASSFSPDGRMLVIQRDAMAYIYDIEASPPKLLGDLKIDSVRHHSFRWTPDSKRLFCSAGSWMGDWDMTTGKQSNPGLPHGTLVFSIDFTADGRELLTADIAGKLIRWSMPDQKIIATRPEPAVTNELRIVNTANYLPDGKRIFTEGHVGTFTWLDRDTFKQLETHHQNLPRAAASRFIHSREGNVMAFWDSEEKPGARIIKPAVPAPMVQLDTPGLFPRAFTADGKILVATDADRIYRGDVDTGKMLPGTWTRPKTPQQAGFGTLNVSPDGRWLIENTTDALNGWRFDKPSESAPAWSIPMSTIHPPNFTSSGGLAYFVEAGGMRIIEPQTGTTVAYLGQRDAVSRLVEPVPWSPMVLVISGARHAAFFDTRAIITATADPKNALAAQSAAELWQQSAGDSAAAAYAALIELQRRNDLTERAKSWAAETANAGRAAEDARLLVKKLNDPEAKVREAAHRDLERLGKPAAAELRKASPGATGEFAERLQALLRVIGDESPDPPPPDKPDLRAERVLEVLAWSDDAAYKAVRASLTGANADNRDGAGK